MWIVESILYSKRAYMLLAKHEKSWIIDYMYRVPRYNVFLQFLRYIPTFLSGVIKSEDAVIRQHFYIKRLTQEISKFSFFHKKRTFGLF